MVRVFDDGPEDMDSISGQVMPKTQKMVLDTVFLNTQHYKIRIKWSNQGRGVKPFPTPWCSSYRKRRLYFYLHFNDSELYLAHYTSMSTRMFNYRQVHNKI